MEKQQQQKKKNPHSNNADYDNKDALSVSN